MTDFRAVLEALSREKVEFILIGGVAAIAHGSPHMTNDIDFVYSRSSENIARLVKSLAPFRPYPRGAPRGLPFVFDAGTIRNGLNFTFETTIGDIDPLGEITGGGGFDALVQHTERLSLYGGEVLCLNLDTLIHVKRAAGRPKDFEAIAALEALREETPK